MESLVGEIIGSNSRAEIEFAVRVLQDKPSYDAYFTSDPLPGSITEEIAEYDAQVAKLEQELRSELIKQKSELFDVLLSNDWSRTLADISTQLEKLWELNKDDRTKDPVAEAEESEGDVSKAQELNDAFHEALEKVRRLQSAEQDTSLVTVLNNIDKINDILELPSLISTCIRTGHYQEVLLLYSYSKTLEQKFPQLKLISTVVKKIQDLISSKMLNGLVRLLSTNLTLSSMKKIVSYLEALEPFDTVPTALQQVLLTMRYKFVTEEIESYRIVETAGNTVKEMLIKRKVECIREHVYGSISVFNSLFKAEKEPLAVPLHLPGQDQNPATVETSPLLLKFINECTNFLLNQLQEHKHHLTESVCLQLVYCSFRLSDANVNFHHLFMNKLQESSLFTTETLTSAIQKRLELATRY